MKRRRSNSNTENETINDTTDQENDDQPEYIESLPADYIPSDEELKPLNSRQELMLDKYFTDPQRRKYKAYKDAGYKARGGTGRVCATQQFAKPNIKYNMRLREAKLRQEAQKEAKVTFDWVLDRLKWIADFDIAKIFDPVTEVQLPIHEWPIETRKAISSVDFDWEKILDYDGKETLVKVVSKIRGESRTKALQEISDLMKFKEEASNTDPEEIVKMITAGIMAIANSIPIPLSVSEETTPLEEEG